MYMGMFSDLGATLEISPAATAKQRVTDAYVALYQAMDRVRLGAVSIQMQEDIRRYQNRWEGRLGQGAEMWGPATIEQANFDATSMGMLAKQVNQIADHEEAEGPVGGGTRVPATTGGATQITERLVPNVFNPTDVSPQTKYEIKTQGPVAAMTTPAPNKKPGFFDWSQLVKLVESGMVGYSKVQKQQAAAQLLAIQQKGTPLQVDKPTQQHMTSNTWIYAALGIVVVGGVLYLLLGD